MSLELNIRPLSKSDDRSAFSCGVGALDRFFVHYAGQNQFKKRICVNYIATRNDTILGYVTIVAGSLEKDTYPNEKTLKRLPPYPLPILRVARLAVDQNAKGKGVGQALLKHAFNVALIQRDTQGCVGVVVDAKQDAVEFYSRYGFQRLVGVLEGTSHGFPTPMFLPISLIASSIS